MIKTLKNIDEIADAVAKMLLELMSGSGETLVHIALSGGNTPKSIFKYLSDNYGNKLANNRFHFWWGDERCVPSDDNDSNFKWAYELWLRPIGINILKIHRIEGENEPTTEATRYSEEIKNWIPLINDFPRFDLIMLGLGDDGHTASIFPNQMDFLASDNICEVATHPVSKQKRITLTGKVLNNARKVVFVSTGDSKAKMVKNVVFDAKPEFPASHIKPENGELIWLLDNDASEILNPTNK